MDLNSRQYVVSLDMTRTGSIRESFEMRHNDDNELIIELRDSAGIIDLNASGVINATLLVTRKDKVDIPLAGTITPEGRASFKLKRASLEKQGMVEVVAQFYFANDVRISTPTLIFNVLRDPSAGAVGDEGDDRTLIEIILNDAPELLEQLQTAYDELVIQKAAFAQFQTDSETAFSNAQNQRSTDFNADQAARNTAFEDAQTQRATDFNTSQGERATLFNQAQTDRQNDYQTWKDTKDTELNQLASDTENSKLAADTATANANNAATEALEAAEEATGAVAEVTSAKQSTVKNKTFANLDARMEELESDTFIPMKNELLNSDFSQGLAQWTTVNNDIVEVVNGQLHVVDSNGSYTAVSQYPDFQSSDKLYGMIRGRIVPGTKLNVFGLYSSSSHTAAGTVHVDVPESTTIQQVSAIFSTTRGFAIGIRGSNGAALANIYIERILLLNLTKIFGEGKEPSKDQMDKILGYYPNSWFDGTVNLNEAKRLLVREIQTLHKGDKVILSQERMELREGWGSMIAGWFLALPDGSVVHKFSTYVRKLNKDLSIAWSNLSVNPNGTMHFDSSRNIYVPTLTGLVKVNAYGITQTTFKSGIEIKGVQVDTSGNLYVIGTDFIEKMNSSGTMLWQKTGLTSIKTILLLANGNLAVGAWTIDDGLVVYNPEGVKQWGTTYAGNSYRNAYIASDLQSNVYSLSQNTGLEKFNSSGVRQWVIPIEFFVGYGEGGQMTLDNNGNIYVPHFTTNENTSYFAKVSNQGFIIERFYFGARCQFIYFVDKSRIFVGRGITTGGLNVSGILALRQDVLEVS